MLDYDFDWDACQLPLNCFDGSFRSFETIVLPELIRRGIAPIGMKSLCGDGRAVSAGSGLGRESAVVRAQPAGGDGRQRDGVDEGAGAERRRRARVPADDEGARAALRRKMAAHAADGRWELYKISAAFEGEETRRVHGLPPQGELPT